MTAKALKELGYQVQTAADAKEALDYWATFDRQVDLVLTDMVMPGDMNGLDLADRLRSESPEVRVVLMSGYSPSLAAGDQLARRPGVSFLPKPLDYQLLARTVREALEHD